MKKEKFYWIHDLVRDGKILEADALKLLKIDKKTYKEQEAKKLQAEAKFIEKNKKRFPSLTKEQLLRIFQPRHISF